MSCLKGKSSVKKSKAEFVCEKCGAATDKKKDACKPERIKPKKEKDKGKK